MSDNELISLLALQQLSNIGDSTAKKLLQHLGSAEAIFKEKKQNLLKIEGIGSIKVKDLHNPDHIEAAEKELQYIRDNNIDVHYFKDKSYPERLKYCMDGPILLFSRGNIDLQNKKILSIVGARKVTTHGIAFTEKFIEELAPVNPVIVSGFAYGVDITAQKAAVKNNLQTIGCLAHGLNQIYPKTHEKYVKEVIENGGFFTDFWSTSNFDRNNFLKRNRIIAGLSEATVVIESAEKGGSLVTADIANSYNREVFAVPGRSTDAQSKGCNNLIKSQQAHLLTSAADLIYLLDWELKEKKQPIQKQLFVELEPEEKAVFSFLKNQGKEQMDLIGIGCNLPTYKLATILFNMEMKGVVRPLPGKTFELA
ncbi:MAG TPA: DNA-processing protein DprA [Salinimicrobium sp.]|nr:DNA-processing protein DprA [Salinimicrobium sp.]